MDLSMETLSMETSSNYELQTSGVYLFRQQDSVYMYYQGCAINSSLTFYDNSSQIGDNDIITSTLYPYSGPFNSNLGISGLRKISLDIDDQNFEVFNDANMTWVATCSDGNVVKSAVLGVDTTSQSEFNQIDIMNESFTYFLLIFTFLAIFSFIFFTFIQFMRK